MCFLHKWKGIGNSIDVKATLSALWFFEYERLGIGWIERCVKCGKERGRVCVRGGWVTHTGHREDIWALIEQQRVRTAADIERRAKQSADVRRMWEQAEESAKKRRDEHEISEDDFQQKLKAIASRCDSCRAAAQTSQVHDLAWAVTDLVDLLSERLKCDMV